MSFKISLYISLDADGTNLVHVPSKKMFFDSFATFGIKNMSDIDYSFKASTEVEGVRFFTLLTQAEYEKYVKKASA